MTDIPTSTNVPFVGLLVVPRCFVFDDASTVDVAGSVDIGRTSTGGAQNTLGGDLDPKGTEMQWNLTLSLPYNLPRRTPLDPTTTNA